MKSIRGYLLSRLIAGSALVLLMAGGGVYWAVARSLETQFDRNLTDRIQALSSIMFQEGNVIRCEFSDELMPEYSPGEAPAYFELRLLDGRPVELSESIEDLDLEDFALVAPDPIGTRVQHWTAKLPDGRTGRFASQEFEIHHVYPEEEPDRPEAVVIRAIVARGREELVAAESQVMAQCAGFSLLLIGVIGLLAWTSVRRGLAPATRLASAVDGIEMNSLPEHFEAGVLPIELEPMSRKVDALIRRVEEALQRERRTTADIAHELRTPISELLTVSEVALMNGEDSKCTERALTTTRDVAWRMERSVSTLLKLARLEMGVETFEASRVDLGMLVGEHLRSLGRDGRDRELAWVNRLNGDDSVRGDEDALRIISSNLLRNAFSYTPQGGSIECRLEKGEEPWRFVVENDTRDLDNDDLEALTQPFWRKDHARADPSSSGLGLALSSALAEKAEMRLEFFLDGGRFRAELSGTPGPPA